MNDTWTHPEKNEPYRISADRVLAALKSESRHGLSSTEARNRLARHGRNELAPRAPQPMWRKLLAQLSEPLVLLLVVAGLISTGLWAYERESALPYEGLAILAIVILNAVMGYVQQAKAEQAVAALQRMSAARARVIRDGEPQSIAATEVVPGDILIVEEGDKIPADARLLQITALQTAEAALTGESLPVTKQTGPIVTEAAVGDRLNMIFAGTSVTYGHGTAVVTATGMRSQVGQIAGMLGSAKIETTPLQQELARVGKLLGAIVIVIAIVMIGTIIVVEHVSGFSALFDVFSLGVALAVAAVPEGLPAVVTAVLALGVQRMARRNAIVRHLASVETLGSANVIATDKTGTLTRNEMTVRSVVTASGRVDFGGTGYAPVGEMARHVEGAARADAIDGALRTELERALSVGDRASNAVLQEEDGHWSVQGDPTEGALLVAARKAGIEDAALSARFERVGEVPFSSERKLMTTINTDARQGEILRVFTKGAPDVLLGRCTHELVGADSRPLDDTRRAHILRTNDRLAGEALRTLGVAYRSLPRGSDVDALDAGIETELVFAGLIGMIDPPRAEAVDAVGRATRAGVRPMMLTGDHPATAAVIARELGIPRARVVTGAELEKMPAEALERTVREVSVYARVNPEHKLRIVTALQRGGSIVAMTGDGVNDAPALKTADIGVAMGITGTDVSKEASDIILTDDNFASIVSAVEEGRTIFGNIRKFLRYLLASNIGEVMTMFFGVVFAEALGLTASSAAVLVLPLTATQLLWVNLVTDGAPALALGVDPPTPGIMSKPPRPPGEKVITRRMWSDIVQVGVVTAAGILYVIDACLPGGFIAGAGSLSYAQTMAFTTLVFFSLFTVFCSRSDERSAFADLFSNGWLWGAVALSIVLQVAVVYVPFLQHAFATVPLALADWAQCFLVASSVLWLREAVKLFPRMRSRRERGLQGSPGQPEETR
jgi:Ca2+-transporting ATPase